MKIPTAVARTLVILGVFAVASPTFSTTSGQAQQGNLGTIEDATDLPADSLNSFGAQIAGTYLVIRQPAEGSTRILNLFADGNLTGMQSVQFGGGVPREGFSNQHGTWQSIGGNEIEAIVFDLEYNPSTGEFLGTTITHYNLQFDNTLQTVTGTAEGQIFSPGVDPLNPGNAKPFFEFSDTFQAKRVTVDNSGT